MPSPFPGMNPFLEHPDVWEDFHDRYLVYLAETLKAGLPPAFFVRIAEHVFVADSGAEEPGDKFHADVSAGPPAAGSRSAAAVAIPAPQSARLPDDYERDRLTYLEVRDRRDRRVTAVVELLSPANKKPGRDRTQYEAKRRALLASDVNFVELDFLRGWRRMPPAGGAGVAYRVLVSRPDDRPDVGVWPLNLADRLPEIPIPVGPGAAEPVVDLQAVLHRLYDAAGYEQEIYARPPVPPLSAADVAWAEAFIPKGEA